jgi:4-amino-4-deoxy-L-arabinose transferase-like glycosyltransferase
MIKIKKYNKLTSTYEKVLPIKESFFKNHFANPIFQKWALPATLFVFSLTINLIILRQYLSSPFAQVPQWDAENYWKLAQQIASGNILGSTIFHQSPLYPYFLAVLIKSFGQHLLPVYLVQCLLSACSSVLVYLITIKISNQKITSLFAGIMFALFGMQVFYSLKILSECLAVFLMLLATLFISGKEWKVLAGAGCALGLAITLKPHLLLVVPIILVYMFIVMRPNYLSALKKIAVFLLPILIIIAAVAIRNYSVGKDFVLISSNGGENFFIGNHKGADGIYSVVPGMTMDIEYQNADVSSLAEKQTGKKMKRSEISNYWQQQGLQFIIHNPHEYLKLLTKKITFVFSGAERSTMYYRYFESQHCTPFFKIAFVNFYLILPIFFVGLIASFKTWKKNLILFIFIIINMADILIFFYDTRFMLLVMPYWIIIGAIGGKRLWEIIGKTKSLIVLINPLLIVFIIALFGSFGIHAQEGKSNTIDAHLYLTQGDIYFKLGNLDDALKAYLQSSTLNKNSWMPVLGASKVYFKQGKRGVAAEIYNEAFTNLNEDFKTIILRNKDFEPLRAYIISNKEVIIKLP